MSHYKVNSKFAHTLSKDNNGKLFVQTLSYLIVFFFLLKPLHSFKFNNHLSFVALPKKMKYFTLVKGPKGHKSGKFTYSYSYYSFLLVFSKPFNSYLSRIFWYSSNLFNLFNFLVYSYSMSSSNSFSTKKFRFLITNDISFL